MDIDHVPGDNGKYDVVDGIPLGPISFSDLVHTLVYYNIISKEDAQKLIDDGKIVFSNTVVI